MTTAQDNDAGDGGGPFTHWVKSAIDNPGKVHRAMFYVALIFFMFTTLFPIYWLVVLALTPNDLIVNMGPIPRGFNISVFVEMWNTVPLHLYMFNSFVIAIATTVYVLLVSSLAGYAFGRLEFRGKGGLLLLLLIISFFPPAAFILPLFKLFTGNVVLFGLHSPDLFNTVGAIIVPFSGLFLPLSVFILTTFYSQIPDGLEDAARVEGTTRIGALFRVIMPLSAPGLSTAGILTFIAVYNEFFFSFLMTTGQPENGAPLVWGILAFQSQYTSLYNYMAAASLIGILPVALIVVVAQEKIVSGLTAGAVKE
ncbi:multiple sugar transport system permease protein [Halogranum gelatinilyticum]|uniref:Multiple sugar transport system permease protein n=1 Tax=Halogranum gelatinilyticum TaxID=660521 RepID=A0A1G9PQW2_9EURY|nr:carbohydrate ABC transporter permease [Halogranum gelatinilyticum]SDM01134.1 multiple sugar transport system permease protein [Halogranum gelatinilyticum]